MSRKSFLIVLGLLWSVCSLVVFAVKPAYGEAKPDVATLLGKVARDNLTKARLANGAHVPAETPAEKAKPIIPAKDVKRVVDHGIRADVMLVCNLNWEKDFSAFMDNERAKKIWSPKQIAYIGLLHGVSMGYFEDSIKRSGCTPQLKAVFLGR